MNNLQHLSFRIISAMLFVLFTFLGTFQAQANETLTLTVSDGAYSGSGNYRTEWVSSGTPAVTFKASASNMASAASVFQWYSGTAKTSTYTISIAAGYTLTGYTLNCAAVSSDQTVTPSGGTASTITSSGGTVEVTDLATTSTTFTLAGDNTGLNITSIVLTYEAPEELDTSVIYTITNANGRGSLMYYPTASEKWVWSSGKSGTFDSSSTNCQWILYPTGVTGQYYFYNVGAGKFAVPSPDGDFNKQSPNMNWAFSDNPIAIAVSKSGTTYSFATVKGDIHMSTSNTFTGPIISYYADGDIGVPYNLENVGTIDSETQATVDAKVNSLMEKQTALTSIASVTAAGGWYAVRIKTHASYADYFLYTPDEEITYSDRNYALNFYNQVDARPLVSDAVYYFRISRNGSSFYWQMPNGKYLVGNSSNYFPVSSIDPANVSITYNSGFSFAGSSRYAVPYYLSSKYFVGETSNSSAVKYDIYPVDLSAAGLTAWQVTIQNGPEDARLACNRTDLKGLSRVYSNGYFFLPTGVTPTAADFTLSGMVDCTIDEANHTITAQYDPSLALLASDVSAKQGYQTTGRGNKDALLLRVSLAPFNATTATNINFSLNAATVKNAEKVTLYKAAGTNMEFLALTKGTDYTEVASTTELTTNTTFSLGALEAGSYNYFLCVDVKEDAALALGMDATLKSISYECNGEERTLTLNLAPEGVAKIFDVQSTLTYPTMNSCRYWRIPTLIKDRNGNLVAAVDMRYGSNNDLGGHKIDVVSFRSDDNGRTWYGKANVAVGDGSSAAAYGFGDAALARTAEGDLVCLMAAGSKMWGSNATDGMRYMGYAKSTNDATSWTLTSNLLASSKFYDEVSGTSASFGMSNIFTSSGKGLTTNDGVIMFTTNCRAMNSTGPNLCYIIYSTDNGANWRLSDALAYSGCDESKLVQLADGSLLLSVRQSGNRGWNTGTYVKNDDGTVTFTWGTQSNAARGIWGNACNADLVNYGMDMGYDMDVLIHSYIYTSAREGLKIAVSTDKGKTWTDKLTIQTNGSCYSTLQTLDNGDLALLFEDASYDNGNGFTHTYLTITKEQIKKWVPSLPDDPETGINTARTQPAANATYDLSGRRVNNTTRRGVYIINGKKVMK